MSTRGHDTLVLRSSAERRADVRLAFAAAWRGVSLLIVLAALAGCRDSQELEVSYGHRRGAAGKSINGTSVLAGMFEEAGYKISTWRRLATDLQQCDVIVWAPNDFGPPGDEVQRFFEQWLTPEKNKTLVYIGRDFNAEPYYWEAVLPAAPVAERIEVMRRRAQAAAQHDLDRLDMPVDETMEWFTMRRDYPRRRATQLHGPWSVGIDGAKTDIHTQGLLQVPTPQELQALRPGAAPTAYQTPDYESLLSDGPNTLASRVTKPAWGESQVIVVTNGSFLLNLPLVNHEHRKLAGHLVRECRSGSRVAFLESGPGDPLVSNRTPPAESSRATRERVLLAAHWCVLGLVYCFCIYPIFGRAKAIADNKPSEFVQHVDALGELLQRTHDQQYAQRQIEQYHAVTRRDPGPRQRPVGSTTGPRAGTDLGKPPSPNLDAQA